MDSASSGSLRKRYSSTLDRAASIPSAEIVFNLNSIGSLDCSCLQALRENSEKQIPRRLKPPRNDKNKALIGTIKVVHFPRLLALPASAPTSVFFCSREGMPFQTSSKPESRTFNENSTTGS